MQSANREVLQTSLFLQNLVLKRSSDHGWWMIIYKSRDIKKFSANGHVAEAQNIRLSSTKEVT